MARLKLCSRRASFFESLPPESHRQLNRSCDVSAHGVAQALAGGACEDAVLQISAHPTALQILNRQHSAIHSDVTAGEGVEASAAIGIGRRSHQTQSVVLVEQHVIEDVEDVGLI